MKLIVRAKRVRENDTFVLSNQKCKVIKTERNDFGQTIIHFQTDMTGDEITNCMIVNNDLPIEIKK
jgi:hypothetical protein